MIDRLPKRTRPDGIGAAPVGDATSRPGPVAAGNRALARLLLQSQAARSVPAAGAAGAASLADRLHASSVGGQSLPSDVARRLAPHVGAVTASIRVHADSNADVLARAVNAVAFTTGRDIFFRSGSYKPGTAAGLGLLAHEATHAAQQAAGPVSGTPIGDGLAVSDPNDRFEREATAVASSVGGAGA